MKELRRLALACLLVVASVNVARADTITFTYTVTGNANSVSDGLILTYSFVPLEDVLTPLGPLDVRYMGTIDFSLDEPSGPTTSVWDFGALGQFSGTGLEFAELPDSAGMAPFRGTSVIEAGTGIFESASGTTSYNGSLDALTGIATFTERIEITAPGLSVVPEPAGLMLLGAGAFGLRRVITQRRRT